MERVRKQMDSRPKSPDLTPEQVKQTIQTFRNLPKDRKSLIARAVRHPCANCEAEFKLPNTGWSHGICARHANEMRKQMGLPPKPAVGQTVDLAELSPEERQLAVNLFAIIRMRKKG